MTRTETHPAPSRVQLGATIAVTLAALTGLGFVRLTSLAGALPAELELLLGFVFLGGLLLVGIDIARARSPRTRDAAGDTLRPASPVPPGGSPIADAGEPKPTALPNAFLGAIVDRVSVGVAACDANGRLILFNQAARELHGITADTPVDGHLGEHYDLYAGDGVTQLGQSDFPLARALRGETISGEEVMIASRHGWARTVAVSAHPLLDENGLLHGALMTLGDVTEQHRAEQDLRAELERARESDRLKSAFLANMSHEIRTPLNIILGYNSMIAEHFAQTDDSSQQPLFDAIQRASRRLMNTVHGILDISRIEVGAFEIHPIMLQPAAEIERVLQEFEDTARQKELDLTSEIDEPDATVLFDEHCLRRALENLVDNAIKFTATGGVCVRLHRGADGVLALEVRDSGVGIDARYLPRLFQPFSQEEYGYTRRFEGAGLGLALVKSYVEFNHAEISVESRKGQGSVFRIRFPKEAGARRPSRSLADPEESVEEPVEEPAGPKPLVLVVEDDAETQGFMRALLRRRYDVVVAASGEEARRQLAERGDAIRAILMDLSLKGDEDGLMLTKSLRAHPSWKDVPVIAITAHAFLEDQQRALAAGCDAFLAKPFGREELFETMERLLHTVDSANRP